MYLKPKIENRVRKEMKRKEKEIEKTRKKKIQNTKYKIRKKIIHRHRIN